MQKQKNTEQANSISIAMSIVSEDVQDVAFAEAIGRDAINDLQHQGYLISSVYTSKRGGFMVEVTSQIVNTATVIWHHKDDIKDLASLCATIVATWKTITETHNKRREKENLPPQPMKVTLTIGEATMIIEGNNEQELKDIASQLAPHLKAREPTTKAKQKLPTVTGHVPPRREK